MVAVDDFRKGLAVGLVADVPVGDRTQPRERGARAGFRHPGETEVDRIGQDRGEQLGPVLRLLAGAEVGEVARENPVQRSTSTGRSVILVRGRIA